MKSWLYRLGHVILLLIALGACCFLLKGYSDLLDFFPWGNKDSYVIWEPLLLYFILPYFFIIGILRIVFVKHGAPKLTYLIFLIDGLLLAVPATIGFDLETDLTGRWSGVLTAFSAIVISTGVTYCEVKQLVFEIRDRSPETH